MLCVDLKNAFGPRNDADNFTVLLLKLIAKADGENWARLSLGFPVQVEAVRIYKGDCPYKDPGHNEPDWEEIARRSYVNEGR
jgi:hypothetical protein